MADVFPVSCWSDAGQRGLSIGGAAMAAPPSLNRPSLPPVNASSSPKASSNRAEKFYSLNLPYRNKHAESLAVDDTSIFDVSRADEILDVCRESRRQYSPFQYIIHGPIYVIQYPTIPVIGRSVFTGHNPLGAWKGWKSPLPVYTITGSVTSSQPPLKVSQLDRLSVTKPQEPNPTQLLACKSFKDVPCKIANEDITGWCRPKKEGGSVSHDLAIEIPLRGNPLRSPHSPITTTSRGVCSTADHIGVEDTPVPEVPNSNVLESVPECSDGTPTEIKPVIGKTHDDDSTYNDDNNNACSLERGSPLEHNDYEHRGTSTTTPPLSDVTESGSSWDTGSGIFTVTGDGDATPFEGQSSSPSRSKDTENQDQSVLAIDSSEDSPTEGPYHLPLVCIQAAAGYPCSNGKGHWAPEYRRFWSDHYRNHHILYEECQRCKRLFEDERSWTKHQELLRSPTPCEKLSHRDLQAQNDKPNRKGITEARRKEVEEAIDQYTKHGISSRVCNSDEHDKWIDANVKLYINQSDTTVAAARLELGKWLVAWYMIFPGVEIPSNPFTIHITHQELLDLIYDDLVKQLTMEHLRRSNDTLCSNIVRIFQRAIGKWQLQQLQAAQSPKTRRQPANRTTTKLPTAKRPMAKRPTAKRQPAKPKAIKRPKVAEPGPTQAQLEPTMGLPAQPPPLVGYGQAPRLDATASSSYTPNPCDGFSVVGSTPTDRTSCNDNGAPCDDNDPLVTVPKVSENEGQSNQGEGLRHSPMDLSFFGAQHNPQISPQNVLTDPYFLGIRDQATFEATFEAFDDWVQQNIESTEY
ncbi:hypothetical protein VE02_01048 [Pseudogymnoascus sp. 03VT05]|nr:hypothetical protein VE02_01048 [Pseudogymnoascus sp. 03VT05]